MNKSPKELPFKPLGIELKRMREKLQESLIEVSGAVEIEVDTLTAIEKGSERPSEDILLLLISHFGIKEDQATKLWELANYDQSQLPIQEVIGDDNFKQVGMLPHDARITYTDMVHIVVNNYGVVMNFMQGTGVQNQAMAVARVGMSREHAKSVLELLQKTLQQSEQKLLPPSDKNDQNR